MSEAREKYLKNSGTYDCESFGCQAEDYIKELEQQKAELIRILDVAVDLLSDCNYNFTLGKETLEKYK